MTNLAGNVVGRLPAGPVHTFRRAAEEPLHIQRSLLRSLVRRAARTVSGRRFDFGRLSGTDDLVTSYRRAVPLQSYDDIRGLVDRIRWGEPDVMWPGRVTDFAISSGTASAGKIIPLSRETLRKNRRFSLAAALNYFAHTGDTAMWLGKMLSLPGRIEEDRRFPGTLVGEVSGFQSKHAPALVSRLYQAVPHEILFMDNWDGKLDAVVERTMDQDIRVLVMVPSWGLVLFDKLIRHYNAVRGKNVSSVLEVWPNLRVFFSGGVALSSYRDLLQQQIGSGISFVESYGASEGYFAIQDRPDDSDMLLHLDNGVFYEFVPIDQVGSERPDRLWIGEVEPDVRYAMYVSTCSGLWSYAVGDVVRFTSVSPYRIVVAGRTTEMIDKYGEAVFGDEARSALEAACSATGVAGVVEYHIAPSEVGRGALPAHQWLIEFDEVPADLQSFAEAIDTFLQEVNRHYQIRREAGAFRGPQIVPVPRGTFTRWLNGTRERVSAQSKVPRMSEERLIAEGVLTFAAEEGR